jgi:hypothetical protein
MKQKNLLRVSRILVQVTNLFLNFGLSYSLLLHRRLALSRLIRSAVTSIGMNSDCAQQGM